MPKQISIIIVPHDDSRTWNLRLSYRLLYVFLTIAVVAIISGVVFMFTYGKLIVAAERSAMLSRHNSRLQHQVAQIDSLSLELLNLQALSIQIKGMLGVELSRDDSLLVANLSPTANSPAIAMEEVNEAVGTREQRNMLEALPSLWPVKGYVTREFHVTGGEAGPKYHPGIDIAVDVDTPIAAAADGVVELSEFDETYGRVVKIDHGYGIHTLYGHNSRNLVNKGDRITRGQTVALAGSTGKSTAPHLHFEVRKNGVPVDPRDFLLH
jgi:murein DD-endopeptidase MepM/ murein hydrolase activator NlpD